MIGSLARPSPPIPSDPSAKGVEDVLVLVSGGAAMLVVAATALAHVPLRENLWILLSIALDGTIVVYLTAALTVLQRRRSVGAFLALLISNAILAASCAKTMILGGSGRFGDLLLIPDLLRVVDPVLAGTAVLATALLGFAYLVNCRLPRSAREGATLLPLVLAGLFLATLAKSPAVAHATADTLPIKAQGFPLYGHFYAAYTGFARDAEWTHALDSLRAEGTLALDVTPLRATSLQSIEPRNLHIIVMESFTDPAWYPRFGLASLPLPPLFERWRQGRLSTALSPVFGNRSSNAEFEVLCGVPAAVGPSDVVFWRLSERPVPCLPRRLAALGYRSTALHPSPPRTFNLSKAYPALGFDEAAFASDLNMADRDGRFLSAAATLEQHWDRVAPLIDGDAPALSYVFINASHYPYDLDERRRPTRLHPEGASPLVVDYINAIDYAAKAVDRFVDRLLRRDPESLIVVVADHAPALGSNFQGHREGGLIPIDEPAPFDRAALYEVPLIVLDRGKLVPLGRLPTYLVPYAVLDRLREASQDTEVDWDAPWRLRPFRDRALLVERNGSGERLCRVDRPTEPCEWAAKQVRAWQLELLRLIENPLAPPDRMLPKNTS